MLEQERKLQAHDHALLSHETRLVQLEQSTSLLSAQAPPMQYFTVVGWARKCGVSVPHEKALKYGRKAASLSKANGVPVSKIADSKYGQVNAYHADILRVVFSQPV
jgi:hypothetical protein